MIKKCSCGKSWDSIEDIMLDEAVEFCGFQESPDDKGLLLFTHKDLKCGTTFSLQESTVNKKYVEHYKNFSRLKQDINNIVKHLKMVKTINASLNTMRRAIIGGYKCGGYHWAYCDKDGNIIENKNKG